MKNKQAAFLLIFFVFAYTFCAAQKTDEDVIRNLENAEREAILKGDTATLRKLLSPYVVVHNPENSIINFSQINERIGSGKIDYSTFERIIERISFVENIAIVMGKETISPRGITTDAGKHVTRSFTNIWMKSNEEWKLVARQSTIILVE